MVDFTLDQDFSVQMAKLEETDLVHSDTFNPLYKQLINNDNKLNDNKIETSEKGAIDGVATLDLTGNVPATQLNNVHDKYTDSEAVAAINNDTDHGSTAQHNYFSGSHSDLSNVGADDHHTKYTDSEAVAAINNDGDHGSTAQHNYFSGDYNDLSNKPSIAYSTAIPADNFTSGEVSNLRSNQLANGVDPLAETVLKEDEYPRMPDSQVNWPPNNYITVSSSHFSSSSPAERSATITGPAKIIDGFVTKTIDSYSFCEISLDGGTNWFAPNFSAELVGVGTRGDTERASIWIPPKLYIPSGKSFKIRAGSTFDGDSSTDLGAGYYIRYMQL